MFTDQPIDRYIVSLCKEYSVVIIRQLRVDCCQLYCCHCNCRAEIVVEKVAAVAEPSEKRVFAVAASLDDAVDDGC